MNNEHNQIASPHWHATVFDVMAASVVVTAAFHTAGSYTTESWLLLIPVAGGLFLGICGIYLGYSRRGRWFSAGWSWFAVMLSLILLFLLYIMPNFGRGHSNILPMPAVSLKSLSNAVKLYIDDNDNRWPVATRWTDALKSYVADEKTFANLERPLLRCAYAMNVHLSSYNDDQLDNREEIIAFFEATSGWNSAGSYGLAQSSGIYPIWVSFADSGVKKMQVLEPVEWTPRTKGGVMLSNTSFLNLPK